MKKGKSLPLLRNLIYSLVLFEKIKTTKARTKAIQGLVDKLVNKIKKGTVSSKREVLSFLPQKQIVEKLTNEIVPKLATRSGGYTRIIRIGERVGDGAPMVILEWVREEKVPATALASAGKEETKDDKAHTSK